MKKIIAIGIFLTSTLVSDAQSDTSRVEQYCQVIATPGLFSNRVTIDIDYGDGKSFWRDTRLKTDAGKLKKFNTVIDAINSMGREGWIFINAYPVRRGETEVYHFAFKKLFLRSEL